MPSESVLSMLNGGVIHDIVAERWGVEWELWCFSPFAAYQITNDTGSRTAADAAADMYAYMRVCIVQSRLKGGQSNWERIA